MVFFRKEGALQQSAEKLVQRGKIDAAIKEYKKLVAKEGGDINTLNRIGDLYARLRRNDEAVQYYMQTADKYSTDGFYVKAIAVYKKIHRLDPAHLQAHLRLAELYQKQGLVNDARAHYKHLVDYYTREQDSAATIGIYQRLLDLEPGNPTYHLRLAELFHSEGLIEKSLGEYERIAELMIEHGQSEQATQVLSKAFELGSDKPDFLVRSVEAVRDGGDIESAQSLMELAIRLHGDVAPFAALQGELRTETPEAIDEPAQPVAEPAPQVDRRGSSGFEDIAELSEAEDELPTSELIFESVDVEEVAQAAEPEPVEDTPQGSLEAAADAALAEVEAASTESPVESEIELEFEVDLDELESGALPLTTLEDSDPEASPPPESSSPEPQSSIPEVELEIDLDEPAAEPAQETTGAEDVEVAAESPAPPPSSFVERRGIVPPRDSVAAPAPESGVAEKAQDLLAEAEVFVKYGLVEKAIDRLRDVLNADPDHLAAHVRLIRLLVEREAHGRTPPIVDSVRAITLAQANEEAWSTLHQELVIVGYQFEGDRIVATPDGPVEVDSAEGEDALAADELSDPSEVETGVLSVPEIPTGPEESVAPEESVDSESPAAATAAVPEAPAVLEASGGAEAQPVVDAHPVAEVDAGPAVAAEPAEVAASSSDLAESIDDSVGAAFDSSDSQAAEAEVGDSKAGDSEAGDPAVADLPAMSEDPESRPFRLDLGEELGAEISPPSTELVVTDLRDEKEQVFELDLDEQSAAPSDEVAGSAAPSAEAFSREVEELSFDFDVSDEEPPATQVVPPSADGEAAQPSPFFTDSEGEVPVPAEPTPAAAHDVAAEVQATAPPQISDSAPPDAAPPDSVPPDPAPPESVAEPVTESLGAVDVPAVETPEKFDLGSALREDSSWLQEEEDPGASEQLFDEEEGLFDLAAEIQAELSEADDNVVEDREEESLEDIVEEFKRGVSENLAAEDSDTHYNLGIAYREMMLIDEAIGEFQIAAKDNQFLVEANAMLGLCFREKGLSDLAAKSYRRALSAEELAEERRLGLLYDLADLYAELDERAQAYELFVEIYGTNSNYRDVAGRLQALEPAASIG